MPAFNQHVHKLQQAAARTIEFFASMLKDNGSYGDDIKDIGSYFKSPLMFILAGKPDSASLMLENIQKSFMQPTGDFMTSSTSKSANGAYGEYWAYPNGWIVRAAQKLKHSELEKSLVEPGYQYLYQYYNEKSGGFLTNKLEAANQVTDVFMTAHWGLLNLERENLAIAEKTGDYICHAINKQKDTLNNGLYLRLDNSGNLVQKEDGFHFVSRTQPDQLYFMVGYPAAYLAMLYQKTNQKEYLEGAKAYVDFALDCHESVKTSMWSHKIAWACSIIYIVTKEEKYLSALTEITQSFLSSQENGLWYMTPNEQGKIDLNNVYDQSAEIACWFMEIANNLNTLRKEPGKGSANFNFGNPQATPPKNEEKEEDIVIQSGMTTNP